MAKVAEFGQVCQRDNVTIMAHMSTANVAGDRDLLRKAVGDAGADLRGHLLRQPPRRELRRCLGSP